MKKSLNRIEEAIESGDGETASNEILQLVPEPEEITVARKAILLSQRRADACLTQIKSVLVKHNCRLIPFHNFIGGQMTSGVNVESN